MAFKEGHGDVKYEWKVDEDETVNLKNKNVVLKMAIGSIKSKQIKGTFSVEPCRAVSAASGHVFHFFLFF